jgi:hypothetical protein
MDDNPAIRVFIVFILFIVLDAGVIFMFARKSNEDAALEKEAKWDYAVENGFTFYLDGREVDPGTISMKQYDVEFDEEAKKVFLTGKTTASLSQITVAISTLPQPEGVLKIKYKAQNTNNGQVSAPLTLERL